MKQMDLLKRVAEAHDYPLLFATVSGAHLYGFPSVDSDFDLRGAHMLPLEEVVGLDTGPETLDRSDILEGYEIDLVTHDIAKFFKLMLKNNGYVLEQLYSPIVVSGGESHEELKRIGKDCITRFHSKHYIGFAKKQWQLFEDSRRVKPLLYVYRVILTGINLMRTGKIEANLVNLNESFKLPYLPELIDRKLAAEKGVLDDDSFDFHHKEIQTLMNQLESSFLESTLPEEPSAKDALDDLLKRLRLSKT